MAAEEDTRSHEAKESHLSLEVLKYIDVLKASIAFHGNTFIKTLTIKISMNVLYRQHRSKTFFVVLNIILFLPVASGFVCSPVSQVKLGDLESSKIVLITGFEPFATHEVNPSQLIVESIHGENMSGFTVVSLCLPVNFTEAVNTIRDVIDHL